MTAAARERARIQVPILAFTAAAWALLLVLHGTALHSQNASAMPAMGASPDYEPLMNAPAFAADWLMMLLATMTPTLVMPICYVRDRSFASRRAVAILLFVAAYFIVWMAAGFIIYTLWSFAWALSPAFTCVLVVVAILTWQFSPAKQRCLNRCHRWPQLTAVGRRAHHDALRFGTTHAVWCVASCWLLMLVPLMVPVAHAETMAAVAFLVYGERVEIPREPRWRIRFPAKASKLLAAQARLFLPPFTREGQRRSSLRLRI